MIHVSGDCIRYRSPLSGWQETPWSQVSSAAWSGQDAPVLTLKDNTRVSIPLGSLSDADRQEVAGWIHLNIPSGLKKIDPPPVTNLTSAG